MTTIPIKPLNQLNEPTSDGKPDENREFNCVPDSLAMVFNWLLKTNKYHGDLLKDAACGQGYVGFTAASEYVSFARSQGIKLYPVEGYGMQLVQLIHQYLAKGLPVVATEPDPYVNPSKGWSHVILFYADQPGQLTAMDPYGAHPVTRSDKDWAAILQFHEIWIGELLPGVHPITMSNYQVPTGWRDDGTTLLAPNNIAVVKGFREWILDPTHNWHPSNFPLQPEEGITQLEISNPALGSGTWQPFRWTVLEWTTGRGVFEMWTGQELVALRKLREQNLPTLRQILASAKLMSDSANHLVEQLNALQ